MTRLCERPGCSDRADVSYGFDAELLVVWLDGFQFAQGARSGVLCRRHADAMVVPLGWMLEDRRDPVPRLFKAPEPVGERVVPRKRRSAKVVVVEQLRFDVIDLAEPIVVEPVIAEPVIEPVVEPTAALPTSIDPVDPPELELELELELEPASEAEPLVSESVQADVPPVPDAAEPVAPWQPVFDQQDDLKGLLNARGRLLSRAFTGFGDAANN